MKEIPHVHPKLISERLDSDFFVIVNPYRSNAIKVVNKLQRDVILRLDGTKDIDHLTEELRVSEKELRDFLNIFTEKDFINYSGEFLPQKWPDETTALNLWVHTTESCTLRCSYCYIEGKHTQNHMQEETIRQIEQQLIRTADERNLQSVYIRLSGGEAMIRFKEWKQSLQRLFHEFESKECAFQAGFLSNLTLLTNEMISFFKEYDIPIGVSLDGLKEYHDRNRKFPDGSGSFSIVSRNLDKLLDNGIRVNILTVVSNENMAGLPDFCDWLVEKRLPFRFSFVSGVHLDYSRLDPILEECYRRFEKHIEAGYPFTRLHSLCDLKFNELNFWTCSSGFSTGTVHVNGDVYFCQVHLGSEKVLGSVVDEHHNLLDIIEQGAKYKGGPLPEECEACVYRYICSAGCPLFRENGKSSACSIYKKYIPIIYRLMGLERLKNIREGQKQDGAS